MLNSHSHAKINFIDTEHVEVKGQHGNSNTNIYEMKKDNLLTYPINTFHKPNNSVVDRI